MIRYFWITMVVAIIQFLSRSEVECHSSHSKHDHSHKSSTTTTAGATSTGTTTTGGQTWVSKDWSTYENAPVSTKDSAPWGTDWGVIPNGWAFGFKGTPNWQIISDPAGTGKVLEVKYPAGSYKPKASPIGGIGFYAEPIKISNAVKLLNFTYEIYFDKNFKWEYGGKLPGLYGGAKSCSGVDSATNCFSTRFMWRSNAWGEVLAYLDQSKQVSGFCQTNTKRSFENVTSFDSDGFGISDDYSSTRRSGSRKRSSSSTGGCPNYGSDPKSVICNSSFGVSLGRSKITYTTGEWITLNQVIKMNDPGKTNGYITFSNGKQSYTQPNLSVFSGDLQGVVGIDFETFFGGGEQCYATTVDTYTLYRNFKLTIS